MNNDYKGMTITEENIKHCYKYSIIDERDGKGIVIIKKYHKPEFDATRPGHDPYFNEKVDWELWLEKTQQGLFYTNDVEWMVEYLNSSQAKKHWTVGA